VRRIAGVSPACGCTQPLVIEFFISTALLDWLTLTFCRRDSCDPADDFLLQKRLSDGSRASRLRAVVLNR
ncbi:MAG: hypothetical protein LBP59_03415, partial [Planctomycetaceae bacterium]|nr:hypothetical protein [Planctomycetaceae bacterium]